MTSKTRTFSPSLLFFCIFSFLWPSLPRSDLHRYEQICHSLGLCSSLHTPYREPHGNYTAEEEQLRVVGSELEQDFSEALGRAEFCCLSPEILGPGLVTLQLSGWKVEKDCCCQKGIAFPIQDAAATPSTCSVAATAAASWSMGDLTDPGWLLL